MLSNFLGLLLHALVSKTSLKETLVATQFNKQLTN